MFALSTGGLALVNLLNVSKICSRLTDENGQQYYDVFACFDNGDFFHIARFIHPADLKDYFKKLAKDLNDESRSRFKGRAKFGGKLNGGRSNGTVQDNSS